MKCIYNCEPEIIMRVLIILKESPVPLSEERIAFLDFVSTYGEVFGISEANLHGSGQYIFSEFPNRRELVINSLKIMINECLIVLKQTSQGRAFAITVKGNEIASLIYSEYGESYRMAVSQAINKYSAYSDAGLIKIITRKALEKIKEKRNGIMD